VDTTAQDTEVVDAIRLAIGRDTLWYVTISSYPCPLCDLDPVSNTSTDSFCNTCGGDYWIPVQSGILISGHVTWGHSELLNWQNGGKLDDGECRVQVKYDPDNLYAVDNADYVIVDEKKMNIKKRVLRGVQNINRILVDLIEEEKE
jgi:hypothetical protein